MLNKGFCVNNGEIKIDNGILRVIVDYQRGGNISSLYFNNKNFELLFQPKHSNLDIPQKGDSFEKYAATGFDDTFPNIDAEKIIYSGREITYNDHGDIWTSRMNMLIDNEDIVLYSENDVYFFEKRISLNKNSLILKYRIKNISENIYPCFYTMYCLFDLYEDMHIIFPKGTDLIENALCDEKLNNKREMHKFFGDRYSIGTDEICSNGYEKFYICGAVSEGKHGGREGPLVCCAYLFRL